MNTLRGLPSIGSGCVGLRNEIMPPGSPQISIDGSVVSFCRCRAAIWSAVTPTPVASLRCRGWTQFSQVSCSDAVRHPALARPCCADH